MVERSGERLARDLYHALSTGDRAALGDLLHPDFTGRVTDGLLDVGGVHTSPEAMLREVWGRIGQQFRVRVEPEEFRAVDDGRLLVLGRYLGRARVSGGSLDAAFVHLIRTLDGRIAELTQLTDSQRFAQALADGRTETGRAETGRTETGPAAGVAQDGLLRRELSVVAYQIEGGLATVTLNRPEARNAIDEAMAAELYEVALRCAEEPELRAVLITATGPSFTVGGDIRRFAAADAKALPGLLGRMVSLYHRALDLFRRLDAPVVCAVRGGVAGGGLGLAYCADIVLAADDARFTLGFGGLGLSGDGGSSWFLPRLVGPRRAAELYFEQRVLTAAEAVEWGIASRVVPAASLHSEAFVVARRLAEGPTRAYAEIRGLLRDSADASLTDQLAAEQAALMRTAGTPDAAEGIAAFGAKRTPRFRGR